MLKTWRRRVASAGGVPGVLRGGMTASLLPLLGMTGAALLARLLFLTRPARRAVFTGATKGQTPR